MSSRRCNDLVNRNGLFREPSKGSGPETAPAYRIINRQTLPDLCPVTWSTLVDGIGRRFFVYSHEIILKLGTDEGEAAMTELAHSLLGPVVPRRDAVVPVAGPPAEQGLLLTRQPGLSLLELWPSLGSDQRAEIRNSLVVLLVRMREPRDNLNYYGRPAGSRVLRRPSMARMKRIHSVAPALYILPPRTSF